CIDSVGRRLARIQQVAERTWPRGLGCSVRAHTVAVDEELAGRAAALLGELGWQGLSELQFLVPDGGGEPQLIDFNGRFYGSMPLAIGAGVNLPDIWARSVTSRDVPEPRDAEPGVRYQWLEGDLRAAREDSRGTVRDLVGARGRRLRAPWPRARALPGLLGRACRADRRGQLGTARRGARCPVRRGRPGGRPRAAGAALAAPRAPDPRAARRFRGRR